MTKKNHAHRALCRRQRDVTRRAERQRGLLAPVPAEIAAPATEGAEQDADPAEQRDQRQHRPDEHVGRRLVVHARLGRPVVGVRVVVTRALRRCRPGRPREERRQLAQVGPVGDRLGPQAVDRRRVREEAAVVRNQRAERGRLAGGQGQRPAALVVAIGAEILDRLALRVARAGTAEGARDEVRGPAQVVGGEVRARGTRRGRTRTRTPSARCAGRPAGLWRCPPPCRAPARGHRPPVRGTGGCCMYVRYASRPRMKNPISSTSPTACTQPLDTSNSRRPDRSTMASSVSPAALYGRSLHAPSGETTQTQTPRRGPPRDVGGVVMVVRERGQGG